MPISSPTPRLLRSPLKEDTIPKPVGLGSDVRCQFGICSVNVRLAFGTFSVRMIRRDGVRSE